MQALLNNDELSLLSEFHSILKQDMNKCNYLIYIWKIWNQICGKDLISFELINNKEISFKSINSEFLLLIPTIEALLLFSCIYKRSNLRQTDMKNVKVENILFKKYLDIDKFLAEKICKDIISWKTIEDLKHSYFNKISFIDRNTIKLKTILNEEVKNKLLSFVLFSRESKEILQASSNSISILNVSDFSFAGKDLSNISIPKANLSWNNWIHVNFTNSDLSKVNFTGSNLNCCNFQNCIMIGVKFGILYPNNPHSKPISIFAFSYDKHIIATWSLDKTIKIWNFKSNKVLHELKPIQSASCFQFSPCSKILAFRGDEGIVYLWYIEEDFMGYYESNGEDINQILFSKSGKHVIYSSEWDEFVYKEHGRYWIKKYRNEK